MYPGGRARGCGLGGTPIMIPTLKVGLADIQPVTNTKTIIYQVVPRDRPSTLNSRDKHSLLSPNFISKDCGGRSRPAGGPGPDH